METLKYTKVRTVKNPNRAHLDDAGIDFYIPEDITIQTFLDKCNVTKDYVVYTADDHNNIKTITLSPGASVLIPSGIHVKVPTGYALVFMNKSGVASKKHLHVGACVVDSGYQGECHINITNVGDVNMKIEAGEKIVQGLLLPISTVQTEEVSDVATLYADGNSSRGTGGFGSSGN